MCKWSTSYNGKTVFTLRKIVILHETNNKIVLFSDLLTIMTCNTTLGDKLTFVRLQWAQGEK